MSKLDFGGGLTFVKMLKKIGYAGDILYERLCGDEEEQLDDRFTDIYNAMTRIIADLSVDPVTPVTPGEDVDVPPGKTAAEFAAEINESAATKAKYLKAPGDVEATDGYRGCFAAVPSGETKVTFMLNADGTNAVVEAEDEAKTNLLAAVLAAVGTGEKAATLVIANPMKGFYYCLVQQEQLTDTAVPVVEEKLAGEGGSESVSLDVWKWPTSGFYRLIVSPTPLVVNVVQPVAGTAGKVFLK